MSLTAIDLGFIYTKGIVNGTPILMKSIVGEGQELIFKGLDMSEKKEDNIVSRMNGEEYFVSDLAINQSDTIYHSLKPNRFDSRAVQVLVNTILGIGLGEGHHSSDIVSGLPVSHYKQFRESIEHLFLGEGGDKHHKYDVTLDNEIHIKGECQVSKGVFIPQPFGALVDEILDDEGKIEDKELATKTVAVIDIGFGTTDVYVVNGLTPVERLTFSTQTAMNHAYRLISDKIQQTFKVTLALHSIEKIINAGEFRKDGKVFSMEKVINWAYRSTSQQLLSEIFNKWKTLHEIDYIRLAGGGGIALQEWITPEFSNIKLAKRGQMAVVNGYYKWGKRTFKPE